MVAKTKGLIKFLIEHSLIRYILVGGTTFAIDFLLLVFLHSVIGINVLVAASLSYWISIAFNFCVNRFWTFGTKELNDLTRHLVLYLILLGFNYLFTIVFIAVAVNMGVHYTVAKILAVGAQLSWTYLTYKKLIFK